MIQDKISRMEDSSLYLGDAIRIREYAMKKLATLLNSV